MAKIKHTKTELKAQRDALARFERFLPMLQLKKQQLQVEIQTIGARLAENQARADKLEAGLSGWVRLLGEPVGLNQWVAVDRVEKDQGNIAGVVIPILRNVKMKRVDPDLFATPPWVDEAIDVLGQLVSLRIEREVLEEQRLRITEELRTTAQRVNLFEKVKIPESKENIREIKIFLGDEQTAAVARGKIAKKRAFQEAGDRRQGAGGRDQESI
jgi:V/A-type H+/Na+-transporting ATPase subunit D